MAGTISFKIDLDSNEGAFREGNDFDWGEYDVNGRKFAFLSNGPKLVVRELFSDGPVVVLEKIIDSPGSGIRTVTLTWDINVSVYWDAEKAMRNALEGSKNESA